MIAGGRYAFQVIHPGSSMLRVRYRAGIAVGPFGFPDWIPYARAVVEPPPAPPGLGVDEARVIDVLSANRVVAGTGDPLYDDAPAGGGPPGWTWAHLPALPPETPQTPRRMALVPVELHGAYRHQGGVSTATGDRARRGLGVPGRFPVPSRVRATLHDDAVAKIERQLGLRLPAAYRKYLQDSDGAGPHVAAVHIGHGFVADQPLFGAARADALQDLVYANAWFGDRLTNDFIAVGYVQGGLIAVRVRGGDEGSVWYWDDDDPRATDDDTAADVCERLLHRCADDFETFWLMLCEPPGPLQALADAAVPVLVRPEGTGAQLPAARRFDALQPKTGA